MKKYRIEEFFKNLDILDIKEGDVLFIHSSLFKFGLPSDCEIAELPEKIYNELTRKFRNNLTIAVPTFNFDFCKGYLFDRQNTPSKKMGVFSEFVRKLPEAGRSYHPMQSVAVVGPKTDFIIENDTESSFSKNGPFDRMRKLNAKVLLLGADFNYTSFIHFAEEKYKVPYRFRKVFSGIYIDKSFSSKKSYSMYVRKKKVNALLKIRSIEMELIKKENLKKIKMGAGYTKIFDVDKFLSIAESRISKNPYFFVSNHVKFEKII